ncbi:MAG: cytochrome C [Xanthobacteraceae bacterium]|jgi:sulfide dehydrogenase cytochrome subunit
MAAIGRPIGIFGTPRTDAVRVSLAYALAVVSFAAAQAAGLEPPTGASSCTGCHPTKAGIDTSVPTLAGRNAGDIVAAMEAFRNGQKPATVMDRIAKGFTVEEVQAIAAWYAAQR